MIVVTVSRMQTAPVRARIGAMKRDSESVVASYVTL